SSSFKRAPTRRYCLPSPFLPRKRTPRAHQPTNKIDAGSEPSRQRPKAPTSPLPQCAPTSCLPGPTQVRRSVSSLVLVKVNRLLGRSSPSQKRRRSLVACRLQSAFVHAEWLIDKKETVLRSPPRRERAFREGGDWQAFSASRRPPVAMAGR